MDREDIEITAEATNAPIQSIGARRDLNRAI
jgi:hypothetical protein